MRTIIENRRTISRKKEEEQEQEQKEKGKKVRV